MKQIYARIAVAAWMVALGACSSSAGSIDTSSAGADGGVSKEYSAVVEQSVIDQLSAQFKLDANDLESSNIQIHPVPGTGPARYHAAGDFILSWTQPKNIGEVAQQIAQRNICAVAPDHCQNGFRHTVYLDVIATADPTGLNFTLAGDANIDHTIADGKQAAAAAAAAAKQLEQEQAMARERQAAEQQAMEERRREESVRKAEADREKQALAEFDARQRRELQTALADLDTKQQQQRADLTAQMAQARRQLQAQQSAPRSGPMTIQMARQGQQNAGGVYSQMADIDRQRQASYGNANAERQTLISQIQTRQAKERQLFIQQLQASAPAPNATAAPNASPAPQARALAMQQAPSVSAGEAVQGPSFDCAKASTSTEHAICNSTELSQLDSQVGVLYRQAMASVSPDARQTMKSDQQQWIMGRQKQCQGDAQCIAASLQSRATQLRRYLQ